MTLTQVGDDWPTIRARMKRLRHDLDRDLGAVEWVWSVEKNPRGTGHHVHAWQRGDFLSQRELSRMADRRGMGFRVDIRRWEGGGEAYGLKGVGYGMKAAEAAAFLELNGKRLTHQSRGFFVGGVRAAEARGVAAFVTDPQTWELVSVSDLHSAGAGTDDPAQ